MANLYNDQRVLGIRLVADGTVIYNNQAVIGVVDAAGSLFVNNIRTIGVDVLSADEAVHNEQPMLGAVLIADGRKLYNGMLVVPAFAVSGSLGADTPPTGFALTDIASGRLFQRTKTLTTGPVSASGTYSGGTPNAIQLQVLKVSDNSVVKDWTAASATIGGGNWTATVTGVPQGGSYYVKARPANAAGLAQTGANPFYVGILIVMYGQSNMLFMSSTFSSPPAATAGTTYFDGSGWVAVPGGNGVREMLNALIAATGVPCAALNGAVSGVPIASLTKAGGVPANYAALAAQITAAGSDFEFVAWHQGEGDSANGTSQASYLAQLSQLHSDLVTDFGRTKAQAPLVVAGLSTNTSGSGFGTDASWDTMQRTLLEAGNTLTACTYSHSNMDAALSDGVHFTAASYGRAGKRYARTMSTLLGSTSGYPKWSIASAAVVDATHTTVDLTHGIGTDFTPTSEITGFALSNDNGADGYSVIPSAAVWTSATRITLSHSSLVTTNLRKLRYQYGFSCDVSAPVVDNSSLAAPLLPSADVISPTPLSTLPGITYASSGAAGASTAAQSRSGVTVPGGSASLLALIGVTLCGGPVLFSGMTVTAQPGAIPCTVTLVDKWDASSISTNNPMAAIYQAILPTGTTSIDITVNLSANPFAASRIHVATIPVADLSSTTPVGNNKAHATTTTTASCNLATSSGGVIFAIGADMSVTGGNTGTFATGSTETFGAADNNALTGGGTHTVDSASNTAANASGTVTITFGNSAHTTVVAGAWR